MTASIAQDWRQRSGTTKPLSPSDTLQSITPPIPDERGRRAPLEQKFCDVRGANGSRRRAGGRGRGAAEFRSDSGSGRVVFDEEDESVRGARAAAWTRTVCAVRVAAARRMFRSRADGVLSTRVLSFCSSPIAYHPRTRPIKSGTAAS